MHRRLSSTADTKVLPQPKPRTIRDPLIVPSIGSRDVAWAEWPYIWRFEQFLQLLDVVNDAFNVHVSTIIHHEVQ
jgi:hypothetical protein